MMRKQRVALVMTAAMAFSSMPAYAENIKHERVYAVTDPSGQVDTLIDNIRLENKDQLDEIEDSSWLNDIENVGGQESFSQDGEKITWQAEGNDIVYQGTGDKKLPVVPVVKVTADDKEVSGDALNDLNGKVRIEVTYETSQEAPEAESEEAAEPESEEESEVESEETSAETAALAASLIMLPSEGISDVKTTNAQFLEESGMQCVAGWGAAGLGEKTDSFSVEFTADHADLSWMYTVCSSEPAAVVKEMLDENLDADISLELGEVRTLLDALADDQTLPETTGKTKDAAAKINEMNQGLSDLDDGASQVADGASQLSEGAGSAADGAQELYTGMQTLTSNDQKLRDGMSAMLDAVLATANEQIAASGLADSGITVPELTQENYQEVLNGLVEQLSPEGVKAAVREQVRAQVEENREQIEAAVDEEVKKQVIEGILSAMKMDMTAEDYLAGVESGDIAPIISEGVNVALKQQLNSENVKSKRDAAVEEQIEKLVEEHTQEYMDSEEGQAKVASAGQGYESLQALSTQLSQVGELKNGIDQYTAGVEKAMEGTASLCSGLDTLKTGASDLSKGAGDLSEGFTTLHTSLTDAEKQAADTLISWLDSDMGQMLEKAADAVEDSDDCGYDLRPDNMKTITTFIIRTDF